jgi:hypothetical protein
VARPSGPCGPLPAEAKPGEAWCCIFIEARYEDVPEQVCTCPESCTREWIEPVYEEQDRQVCCTPARCERITIPAEYEERSREVCVCPARQEWVKIPCEPSGLAEGEKQGDCWMLKEIPPQNRTVTERVCVKPASCEVKEIPPEFKTVKERVCVKPGEWKVTPVPAKFETRTRKKLVEPCRWEWRRNTDCVVPGAAPVEAPAPTSQTPAPAPAPVADDFAPPAGEG